jgi:hypothetical protein
MKETGILIHSDPQVLNVYQGFPEPFRTELLKMRKLIFEVAEDLGIPSIQETLKWGEPSYLVKKGSTIRLAWKSKTPEQYAIYFKCTSKLVPTFRALEPDLFHYEGNRAIVFKPNEKVAQEPLRQFIAAALRYHSRKDLPYLGIKSQ